MAKTASKSTPDSMPNGPDAISGYEYAGDELDEFAADLCIADVLSAVGGLYSEIDKLAMADGREPLNAIALEQLRAAGSAAALLGTDWVARGALWKLLRTDQIEAADARLLLRQVAHGLDRVAGAAGARRPIGATHTPVTEVNRGTHDVGPIFTRDYELWLAASMG
jgi:hypothetical protein